MIESQLKPLFLTRGDGFAVDITPKHREVLASRRIAALACLDVALLRIIFGMETQKDISCKYLVYVSKVTQTGCVVVVSYWCVLRCERKKKIFVVGIQQR